MTFGAKVYMYYLNDNILQGLPTSLILLFVSIPVLLLKETMDDLPYSVESALASLS